jgi:hypothetical protein
VFFRAGIMLRVLPCGDYAFWVHNFNDVCLFEMADALTVCYLKSNLLMKLKTPDLKCVLTGADA